MASLRTALICFLVSLFLAACVFSYPDYPEHWSSLTKEIDECPQVSGSYDIIGWGDAGSTTFRLHYLFFEDADKLGTVQRVDLQFDESRVLRIQAIRDNAIVAETEFSKSDLTLSCDESGIDIGGYKGITKGVGNPVFGYEQSSTTLMRAVDGSLIIKSSSGGFGLAYLFLPVGGSQRVWYRFSPAQQ